MNDDLWLKDVLQQAAATGPTPADRLRGVFAHVARRRRQRVVAASCGAVVAVFLAMTVTTGSSGSTGLRPAGPGTTPTATETPGADATATAPVPAPGDSATPDPVAGGGTEPDPTPGEPVPFDVGLPPGGGEKLDVYVLLDTTGGMQAYRDDHSAVLSYAGAFAAIDRYLRDAHVDVTWGYGTFGDASDVPLTRSHVYDRIQTQERAVPDFTNLPPASGGGDLPEGTTFALDGSIGIGYSPYTTNTDDATFRTGARKVVLVVTDASMKQGSTEPVGTPPYPKIDDVIMHLNERGVAVVAFQAQDDQGDPAARRDLDRVVGGTGGIATVPLDLDGAPGDEVGRGEPLVLLYDGTGDGIRDFARGLLGLVRSR